MRADGECPHTKARKAKMSSDEHTPRMRLAPTLPDQGTILQVSTGKPRTDEPHKKNKPFAKKKGGDCANFRTDCQKKGPGSRLLRCSPVKSREKDDRCGGKRREHGYRQANSRRGAESGRSSREKRGSDVFSGPISSLREEKKMGTGGGDVWCKRAATKLTLRPGVSGTGNEL